jgi:hypothetical protein
MSGEVVYSNRSGGTFDGVPVMQVLFVACLASSCFACLPLLAFANGGEIFVGTLLLYRFREVERVKGSRQIASQILLVMIFQAVSQLALPLISSQFSNGGIVSGEFASGPYAVIEALALTYYLTVPSTASFQLLGLKLTNNIFTYAGALYLLLLTPKSFASGFIGCVFGLLYELNILGLRNFMIPRFLCEACWNSIGRLICGPDACRAKIRFGRYVQQINAAANNTTSNRQHQQQRESTTNGSNHTNSGGPAAADPRALQALESMGFERQLAEEALRITNNDLNQAMNLLLAQT